MARLPLWLVLLPMLFATASPAREAKTPVPGLPPYGPDRSLVLPQVERTRLDNGLQLWQVGRPGLPLVALRLVIQGGTAWDPDEMRGLSELLADTLAAGTRHHDARALAQTLQAQGAELSVSADDDGIVLSLTGLTDGLETLVALLAEVAREPRFPADEVALAVTNKRQALQAQRNDPDFITTTIFHRTLFGDHPYAYTHPSETVLDGTTPQRLATLHRSRFHPDRALLVAVGDFEPARLRALVAHHFGDWPASGRPLPERPLAPQAPATTRLQLTNRPGSVQSTLRLGHPLPPADDPDHPALQVANTLLGGAFGSRLVRNLREKKGYTYSPGSRIRRLRLGGVFWAQASVRNEVTAAALVEMRYELDRLAAAGPEPDELERGKRYLKGRFLLRNETAASLADTLAAYWLKGLDMEDLRRYVPRIQAVTTEAVRTAAARHFVAGRQAVVITGDAKAIRDRLTPFGPIDEIQP